MAEAYNIVPFSIRKVEQTKFSAIHSAWLKGTIASLIRGPPLPIICKHTPISHHGGGVKCLEISTVVST